MKNNLDYHKRSKEELIRELAELRLKYDSLKFSFESDTASRKLRDKELITSEEKFRKAFVTSPDSININRLSDGLYVSINKGFTKISGYSEEDVIGKTSLELNIWANPADRDKLVKGLREKGEVENLETTFLTKNGSVRNGMMSASIIDLDGVPHILSITRDITDRRNSEMALQKSESRYRELVELAVDGILLGSQDGRIIGANTYMLNLTARSLESLLEMHISRLFTDSSLKKSPLRFDLLQKGEVVINKREINRPDGTSVPVEMHTKIMPDGTYQSIYRDITERQKLDDAMKTAREKAETSDRLKTSFLNNISHEVRTPLNGIIGFAEIISHSDLSAEERDEAVVMVHESSNRLLETITNYMDVSLVVSGEMTLYKKDLVPTDLLRDIYPKYKSISTFRDIAFLLEVPDGQDNHWINTDPELFTKVISHMLQNALKFTEKGSIRFGYLIQENELEFFVSDTGIGIGKESLDAIFEHFVKEDQIKTKPSEGSGLGLTISKGLVGLLGGELKVKSEIGKGSRFFFTLPFKDKTEKKLILDGKPERKNAGILTTIMVAEDDEANYFYLQTLLNQNTKATVIHASNGREAVEKFGENPGIEIILMDIKMPELNGFEATKRIKEINPDIPVIAITAYAMAGDEKRIREAGCDGYISKPISKKVLLEKIEEYFSIR